MPTSYSSKLFPYTLRSSFFLPFSLNSFSIRPRTQDNSTNWLLPILSSPTFILLKELIKIICRYFRYIEQSSKASKYLPIFFMLNFWLSVKNKKTFKETINNQKPRGKTEIRKRPTEDPNNDKQIFKQLKWITIWRIWQRIENCNKEPNK